MRQIFYGASVHESVGSDLRQLVEVEKHLEGTPHFGLAHGFHALS